MSTLKRWNGSSWEAIGPTITYDHNDLVMVQDTQPTSIDNRIWVKPDDNEIEIPTTNEIKNITGGEIIHLTPGYVISTTPSPINLTPRQSSSFSNGGYAIVNCVEGDTFVINGTGGSSAKLWAFIDANNNVILESRANVVETNLKVIAPQYSSKLIINSATNSISLKGISSYLELNLQNNINTLSGLAEPITIFKNGAIYTEQNQIDITDIDPLTSATIKHEIIDCQPNDAFIITGTGGITNRLWVFIDAENKALLKASSSETAVNKEIIAPKNAVKLIVNCIVSYGYSLYRKAKFIKELDETKDQIIRINHQFDDSIYDILSISRIPMISYKNIDLSVSPVNIEPQYSDSCECAIISCSEGDIFTINAVGAYYARAYAFLDSSYNVLEVARAETTIHNELTAPQDSAYLVINNVITTEQNNSYYGTLKNVVGSNGAYNGYFRRGININTVNKQIEIPSQRLVLGRILYNITDSIVPYNTDQLVNIFFDVIQLNFVLYDSISSIIPSSAFFMGCFDTNKVRSASINGDFTVNGKSVYDEAQEKAEKNAEDYNDSNLIIPGKENVIWVNNWTRPEAITFNGIRDKLYFSFTSNGGAKGVAEYNFKTGESKKRILLKDTVTDYHNDLAVHVFEDGIILCAYTTGHSADKIMHIRKSITPECLDYFTKEVTFTASNTITYAQLIEYSNKIYLFYRNSVYKWSYRYSTDRGDTWSDEIDLIISDAQYYCLFIKTTNEDVLRVLMYTNPQVSPRDTNIRQAFFHMDTDTLYNSDNTTILGQSNINKNNISILIANDLEYTNQRLIDSAITDINRPLILYAVFSSYDNSIYRLYDSGVVQDVVIGGNALTNAPYFLGAKFIGTDKMIVFHGTGADGGRDIGTIYSYDGTNITSVKDICNEIRGTIPIRNYFPIVDNNNRVIVWARGWHGASYTDFNTDANIYIISDDKVV